MCLDDDQVLLLLEGKLPEGERDEAEDHLDSCEACRRLVAVAAHTQGGDRSGTTLAGPARLGAPRVLGRGAVVDRYLVLSLLGKGGMGNVYAAYDAELDRRIAVKLLHTARGSESGRRLMEREARALGKLSHPNVVQVYDVGEHEGDVFVAMELVEGQSLDAWCARSPKPGWQEVLGAYLDAAWGLSAAHAKGLVHRDVKPSNILRGNDGRVRVVDFGLAASDQGGTSEPAGSDPAPHAAASSLGETMPALTYRPLDERLTATGMVPGTPLYMAPEQHEGVRATTASDQYSLCVALYAGLYGVPPFARMKGGSTKEALLALLTSKKAGPPASPPPGSAVPAWIHKALARGLAVDPSVRYPSMDALIVALSDDPDARRRARWRRAGIGAAAAAMLAVAAGGWAKSGAFHDPCAHPEQQLEGVWDEGLKGRVRAAFLGTGRPDAEWTVTRVFALLDRYGADWATMRAEVCMAARRDEHHREVVGLRDACLDRRRGQLQALTTLFAEKADPDLLGRAVQAAAALYPLAYCADTETLTARVRPPEDPALRAQVAALQPRVDQLEALCLAGKYEVGIPRGEQLLAETAAIPYAPLRAQVQHWLGLLRDDAGDYAGANALLREAAVSAAEGRDEVLAATAWAHLLYIVGAHQQHLDEVASIRALGPMVMATAHDARARGDWLYAEGVVLLHTGKYAEARDALERSLVLFQQARAPDLTIASVLTTLGVVLTDLGDYPRALAATERGVSLKEAVLGPDNREVGGALTNQANVLYAMGDFLRARVVYERSLAVQEKALGPDHPDVALALNNVGGVLYNLGAYPEARAAHERALAVQVKAVGPDHPNVALSLNNLGDVVAALGDYPESLAMHQRALAIWEKTLGADYDLVTEALVGVSRAQVHLGQLDAALPALERALRVKEKAKGASDPDLTGPLLALAELSLARHAPEQAVPLLERASTLHSAELAGDLQLTLAEALWQVGKDRLRARSLAEQARATYERLGHVPGLNRATRWLAEHVVSTPSPH